MIEKKVLEIVLSNWRSTWLFLVQVLADDDAKKKDDCDRILVNMVDACKGIRNSLISLTSLDQKNMCW